GPPELAVAPGVPFDEEPRVLSFDPPMMRNIPAGPPEFVVAPGVPSPTTLREASSLALFRTKTGRMEMRK
ncbi:hypothetical protein AVEN_236151-1, partial [Araneus ventricosus]